MKRNSKTAGSSVALLMLLALLVLAMPVFAAPSVDYATPTPLENSFTNRNNFTVNITSNETINFTDTVGTRVEWTNQSGNRQNFSLIPFSGTVAWMQINFSSDGRHNFTAYIRSNTSSADENATGATVNFTRNTVPPSISYQGLTPADGTNTSKTYAEINASVTDDSNTSMFIDFNNSLIGYWSFESYDSIAVYDNSTYKLKATYATQASANNIVAGYYGNGFIVNISGSCSSCGLNATNATPFYFQTGLTLEAWVIMHENTTLVKYIVGKRQAWELTSDRTNEIQLTIINQTGSTSLSSNAGIDGDGKWHHIAGTWNGTTMLVYLDGNIKNSRALGGLLNLSQWRVFLGGRDNINTGSNQTSDEVRIWSRALSAEEINASMNSRFYGSTGSVFANFTGLSDARHNYSVYAIDQAGNLNITPLRTVTVDTTPPTVTQPLFNITNANDYITANTTTTDNLASSLSVYFNWSVNSVFCCQLNYTGIASGTVVNSTFNRINSSAFGGPGVSYKPGDNITVTAWAEDGLTNSTPLNNSIIVDNIPPAITFQGQTPAHGTNTTQTWAFINASVSDNLYNTSAFIDFNRLLVMYLSFEYGNGTFDNSTYGNNLTSFGGVSSEGNLTTGYYGKGLRFVEYDSSDTGRAVVSNHSSFNILSALTIEFWVIRYSAVGNDVYISKDTGSTVNPFRVVATSTGTVQFQTRNETSLQTLSSSSSLNNNQWYHVAAVWNGTNKMIYVNGVVDASVAFGGLLNVSTGSVGIGGAQVGTNVANATLDEVKIWSRALSEQEINASMRSAETQNTVYRNFTGLSNGIHNYSVYAIDQAGNLNITALRTMTVDTALPSGSYVFPTPANGENSTNTTWTFNATIDDTLTNINVVLFELDSTNYTASTNGTGRSVYANFTASGLSIATHNYTFWFNDTANNVNNTPRRNFTVLNPDTSGPAITFVSPTPASGLNTSTTAYTFNVTVIDAATNIDAVVFEWNRANESAPKNSSGISVYSNVTKSSLADGTYVYKFFANDTLNNVNQSGLQSITIDATLPNITMTIPANGTNTTDTTPEVTFNITDNIFTDLAYRVYADSTLNGEGNTTNSTITRYNLTSQADGTYTVRVEGRDRAGNSRNASTTITIDTAAPAGEITSPAAGTNTSDTTPEVSFNFTDNVFAGTNGIEFRVYVDSTIRAEGNTTNNTATKANVSAQANGTYAIRVEGRDRAGNAANTTSINITVDDTVPTSTITSPAHGTNTSDTTPEITFNITDNVFAGTNGIEYRVYVNTALNGQGNTTNNTVTKFNLTAQSNGTFAIRVEGRDRAGNSANSTPINITVDDTNPTSTITSPAAGTNTTDTTPEVTFNITDNIFTDLAYRVYVDSTLNGEGNTTNSTITRYNLTSQSDGTYTIRVEGRDRAANAANASTTITIDTTAPQGTYVSPTPASGINTSTAGYTFNVTITDNFLYIDSVLFEWNRANISTAKNASGLSIYSNFTNSSIADGTYVYKFWFNDTLGNLNQSELRNITVDATAPNVTLASPTPAEGLNTSTQAQTFNASYVDALLPLDSCRIEIDGSNSSAQSSKSGNTGSCYNSTTLSEGTHRVKLWANDTAGNNRDSAMRNITVDITAPTVSFTSPTPADGTNTSNATIVLNVTVSDSLLPIDAVLLEFNGVNESAPKNGTGISAYSNVTKSLTFGTHNYSFWANDSAGNSVQSAKRNVTGIYPNLYSIKTYVNDSNVSNSYFANSSRVKILALGDYTGKIAPRITIKDSSGSVKASAAAMSNDSAAEFFYTYVINGTYGWWNVTIGTTERSQVFYVGRLWQSNFTDADGSSFPFRLELNVREPNTTERYWDFVDVLVNYTYGTHNNSVRLTIFNGTHDLEIPVQIYDLYQGGDRVNHSRLVFVDSLGKNENRTYFIHYARSDRGSGNYYSPNMSITNVSTYYTISALGYNVTLNNSAGGVMQSAFSKLGNSSDLRGNNPMQITPQVEKAAGTCGAAQDTAPTVTIDNGPVMVRYRVKGTMGTCSIDYNITYAFFVQAPYFMLEINTSSRESSSWVSYFDTKIFGQDGFFNNVVWRNSSGIFTNTVGSGDGTDYLSQNGILFAGFYSNSTANAVGEVFLNRSQSISGTPSVDISDNSDNENYIRKTASSVSVGITDYFWSRNARVIWNGHGDFTVLNETYTQLSNALMTGFGVNQTNDNLNPVFNESSFSPASPNDSAAVTCNSFWTDNIELDTATITVNATNYNALLTQSLIGQNSTRVNATINASTLEAGGGSCIITVTDVAGLSNSTTIRFNVTDVSAPSFNAVNNTPNVSAELDPNRAIAVTANISEFTNISLVRLEYKEVNASAFTLVTMTNSTGLPYTNLWNASFTPANESTWQYRVFANDTLGNNATSATTNLTISLDTTWVSGPESFGTLQVVLNTNGSLGNVTVNNTGDLSLDFKVTSDWEDKNEIFYNGTAEGTDGYSFTLAPGVNSTFNITVTAKTSERSDSLVITIDALNSSATPSSATSNATITSIAGGPFMSVAIAEYNISVTQNDTGIVLNATVQNRGNESATSAWLEWRLPSGWSVSNGSQNRSIGNLSVNAITSNRVVVSIASTADTGTKTITAFAGSAENKTGTDSKSVVVSALSANTTTTVTTTTTTTVSSGGGGGAAPAAAGGLTPEEKEKLLKTAEKFELVRGMDTAFQLSFGNPFDGRLENVRISVEGVLSRYVKIEPEIVRTIERGQTIPIKITIETPRYFTAGKHVLEFTIEGIINQSRKISETAEVIKYTKLVDKRTVTLVVFDVPPGEVLGRLNESLAVPEYMRSMGLGTRTAESLAARIRASIEDRDYNAAREAIEQMLQLKGQSQELAAAIGSLEINVEYARERSFDIRQSSRLLNLAKASAERENFQLAVERAKEGHLTYALETKGAFNLGFYLGENWLYVGAMAVALIVAGIILFVQIRLFVIRKSLRGLKKEQGILLGMIKELQVDAFRKKKMSIDEYKTALEQYEDRLSKVVQRSIELETMKKNVLHFTSRRITLLQERENLLRMVQDLQRKYVELRIVETRVYENRMHSFASRISEIEEQIALADAERALKKKFKFLPEMAKEAGVKKVPPPALTYVVVFAIIIGVAGMVLLNNPGIAGSVLHEASNFLHKAPQCSDGVDNDRDGKTDYPKDLGCADETDDEYIDKPPYFFFPYSPDNSTNHSLP
ncbi:MAG: hypothetical protein HYW25_06065 [Candidatus Aenigmarchaeota archaeon]|nr:hypothetical protein [Candidatus Aenigmarchaeota archaeon]